MKWISKWNMRPEIIGCKNCDLPLPTIAKTPRKSKSPLSDIFDRVPGSFFEWRCRFHTLNNICNKMALSRRSESRQGTNCMLYRFHFLPHLYLESHRHSKTSWQGSIGGNRCKLWKIHFRFHASPESFSTPLFVFLKISQWMHNFGAGWLDD